MRHESAVNDWLRALDDRHLANLRIQEVTRALRALSSVYVERRDALGRGAALDSAGKRAAFALFYGPLHYLVTRETVSAVGADAPGPEAVADMGCGTGAGGAAWAMALGATPRVIGVDRHPWAVEEASWTYRTFGLHASVRRGDVARVKLPHAGGAIVFAFTVNELRAEDRDALLARVLAARQWGSRVLVLEPIARPSGDWWDRWADAFRKAGGREDLWRFDVELPERVRLLDRAAGLNHQPLTARSLYVADS